MSCLRIVRMMVVMGLLTIGGRTLAEEPEVHRAGGLMLTEADIERIIDESGAAARGGMVRIVECEGAFGYSTIQSAINLSSNGDTVVILPNTCNSEGRWFEHINLFGKSIRVQGAYPGNDAITSATIIDGGSTGRTLQTASIASAPSTAEIAGLSLAGGLDTISLIRGNLQVDSCYFSAAMDHVIRADGVEGIENQLVFSHCRFSGNSSYLTVETLDYHLTINECTFTDNPSRNLVHSRGGEIRILRSTFINNGEYYLSGAPCTLYHPINALMEGCCFIGNRGTSVSALFTDFHEWPQQEIRIRNSLFVGNIGGTSSYGCIKAVSEPIVVEGCTFVGNISQVAGALFVHQPGILVSRCVFYENRSRSYSAQSQVSESVESLSYCSFPFGLGRPGFGNIEANPAFFDEGQWDNGGTPGDLTDDVFIPGDYRLLPGSPCIDAGDPAFVAAEGETDLDGNPRVIGCYVDMGAYESPVAHIAGDFDGDGAVDLGDLDPFVDALLVGSGACLADLNGDGSADGEDLQLFVELVL